MRLLHCADCVCRYRRTSSSLAALPLEPTPFLLAPSADQGSRAKIALVPQAYPAARRINPLQVVALCRQSETRQCNFAATRLATALLRGPARAASSFLRQDLPAVRK